MTATFNTVKLTGNRIVVNGTDQFGTTGSTVVDSTQWEDINAHSEYNTAVAAFDAAVEEFFAPLAQAQDALDKAVAKKPEDSISYVVLHEAEEGRASKDAVIVKLSRDSIVLRIIETGDFSRLIWVNGELEILEAPVTTAAPTTQLPVNVATEDDGVITNPAPAGE